MSRGLKDHDIMDAYDVYAKEIVDSYLGTGFVDIHDERVTQIIKALRDVVRGRDYPLAQAFRPSVQRHQLTIKAGMIERKLGITAEAKHALAMKKAAESITAPETESEIPENLGQASVDWINSTLVVPETGKPACLDEWQERFIIEAYDSKDSAGERLYDTAILSCGRKNGKSTMIAFMILAEIASPWARAKTVICGSTDKESAKVIYRQVGLITASVGFDHIRVPPSGHKIFNLENNSQVIILSSDAARSVAYIPTMVIIDELGYHKDRRLFDALDTSRGAHDPLMVVIGTRGAIMSPLNGLIEAAKEQESSLLHLYAAEDGDDMFVESTWRKANPGLGTIRSSKELARFAEKARTDAEKLMAFKSYYLNQLADPGIETLFPDKAPWVKCGEVAGLPSGPCYGGLDLSESVDPTAIALYWPETHCAMVWIALPEQPALEIRAAKDHLPYPAWKHRRDVRLMTVGRKVIDYEQISDVVNSLAREYEIKSIAVDPWKFAAFEAAAEKASVDRVTGQPRKDFKLPEFIEFMQGYKNMSPAIAGLERLVVSGKLRHNNCPVLTAACASAIIVRDGKLNRMFAKDKSYSRIDAIVAVSMAIGLSERPSEQESDLVKAYRKGGMAWNG